ncbi:hypothetical protein CIHG_03801 [Coccidioides immitis H538.4]|uniref:Uncharacterized protein n=2 Tax=Coccidioides immitis TaxID=5501 RepID=A0A0J8RMC8_COCIT|nr:hypothetical protein CIRG_04982 [Coccidioides immitis RMSCC 2394]KMU85761.1 hypothetical protein CIHG_03801 [Coccidioides immitis H538.4]
MHLGRSGLSNSAYCYPDIRVLSWLNAKLGPPLPTDFTYLGMTGADQVIPLLISRAMNTTGFNPAPTQTRLSRRVVSFDSQCGVHLEKGTGKCPWRRSQNKKTLDDVVNELFEGGNFASHPHIPPKMATSRNARWDGKVQAE